MSVPSKCPRCDQPVMVPDGLSGLARLRCPLCSAEFSAAEVLASAPPLLTVLDLGPAPAESGQSPSAAAAAPTDAVSMPAADAEASAAGPGAAAAVGPAEAQELGVAAGPATDGESVPDFLGKVDEAPQIDLGEAASATPTAGGENAAFAGLGEQEETAEDQGAVDRLLSARRPPDKRREKSLAREMIGALIGGFVGLALGYYLLNFFGGERFDKLPIPLPGIPHTYEHWPFGHAAASGAQDETSPPGTPAGQRPAEPGQSGSGGAGPPTAGGGQPAPGQRPSDTQPTGGTGDAGSQPGSSGTSSGGTDPGTQTLPPESAGTQGSAPEPEPPALGPIDAPIYTTDEVKAALGKANTQFGCWQCNSTGTVTRGGEKRTCPRCKGEPNLELSPEAYDAFCRLAETVTFVAHAGEAPLIDERRATETLLEWIARAPGQLEMAAGFAISSLQTSDGQPQGILMAGTAGPTSEQNGLYGSMVQMAGIPSSYLVLSDQPLPFEADDQVVILGVAVREPAKRVRGYSGSKPVAVWLGAAVKIAP